MQPIKDVYDKQGWVLSFLRMNAFQVLFFASVLACIFSTQGTTNKILIYQMKPYYIARILRGNSFFPAEEFERLLNTGMPLDYNFYGNWLEMALYAGRSDIAFVAYKKGIRLPRRSLGKQRTEVFLETQWSLAKLIDQLQAELRASTIEHGTKYVGNEQVPKEVMDIIAEYVRSSEDVERVFQSIYEGEPINQLLALLLIVLLLLFTLP